MFIIQTLEPALKNTLPQLQNVVRDSKTMGLSELSNQEEDLDQTIWALKLFLHRNPLLPPGILLPLLTSIFHALKIHLSPLLMPKLCCGSLLRC